MVWLHFLFIQKQNATKLKFVKVENFYTYSRVMFLHNWPFSPYVKLQKVKKKQPDTSTMSYGEKF